MTHSGIIQAYHRNEDICIHVPAVVRDKCIGWHQGTVMLDNTSNFCYYEGVVLTNFATVSSQSKLSSAVKTKDKEVDNFATSFLKNGHSKVSVSAAVDINKVSSAVGDWRGGGAAVAGGALVHLALGALYCWGNFM